MQGEQGSCPVPQPSSPRQGSCQRQAGCHGAVGIFQRVSGEQDLYGILESTGGQLYPHSTTSQEGFALLYLEQL